MIITKKKKSKIEFYWDNKKYLGYAYKEVDGFYVFVFDENMTGSWSDYALRAIADKLTELNKEWSEHIDKYFADQQGAIMDITAAMRNNSGVANQNVFNAEKFYLDELE